MRHSVLDRLIELFDSFCLAFFKRRLVSRQQGIELFAKFRVATDLFFPEIDDQFSNLLPCVLVLLFQQIDLAF